MFFKKSLLNKHAQRICRSTFLMDTCAVKSKKMPRTTVQKGLRVQTVTLIILTPVSIHVPIIQQLFEKKVSLLLCMSINPFLSMKFFVKHMKGEFLTDYAFNL